MSKQTNSAGFESSHDDVFGRIAGRYDLLCDLFSFGIHRLWKRRVAEVIAQDQWDELLDVASGTGDIVLRVRDNQQIKSNQTVRVSDISPKMLALAEKKLVQRKAQVKLSVLDAEDLASIAANSVDIYSMSLCMKICNRDLAMQEAWRVLKPGGRMVVLEASRIKYRWLHWLYLKYMAVCMPVLGWIASGGDASAYQYLLKGVQGFPGAEELQKEIEALGFEEVSFERLSLGIVAIHVARKPCSG